MATKTRRKEIKKVTPLMKQYNAIKQKYPDAMLLFRIGDFYETFGEDAIKCAKILNITLTKRGNGSESETALAGFPHHALDNYLSKLVMAGLRVAVCDQLEDPKQAKGIVKRGVTELVTPGLAVDSALLQEDSHNFLAALYMEKKGIGVAFLDISTGSFYIASGAKPYIEQLLQSLNPKEILVQKQKRRQFDQEYASYQAMAFYLDDWVFAKDFAIDQIKSHFGIHSLKGFGIESSDLGVIASGAIFHYLHETKHDQLGHIVKITSILSRDTVWMDAFTIRNLELYHKQYPDSVTLFDVVNKTSSPMGMRLLKQWIAFPSKDLATIKARQEIVTYCFEDQNFFKQLSYLLGQLSDLERLVSGISTGRTQPRALLSLKNSLKVIDPIVQMMKDVTEPAVIEMGQTFKNMDSLIAKLDTTLVQYPPVNIAKGKVIATGVDGELDELRTLLENGESYLERLADRERSATGIGTLKIAFNNVFGYYFEVRNTYKHLVPKDWTRRQTLVGSERYITVELKEYEDKILTAKDKIAIIERQRYQELMDFVAGFVAEIQVNAQTLAKLDCLHGFARLAMERSYVCPQLDESYDLTIKEGRHPVIEVQLPADTPYIPNDLSLCRDQQQIMMITGPNMSGKSAILRQTALIVLLAQIGSYVPANEARIGLVDKIFTRVGASDNISKGESTFMVEMNETASILNNISDRSLVLLDEIGRGTSTYDGIAIAWSIAAFLHDHSSKSKTLFATHYHELNQMSDDYKRIKNYNVAVKEQSGGILFLRKLVAGGSHHSFGIHVAKLAGMPRSVVTQSEKILVSLEQKNKKNKGEAVLKNQVKTTQLHLFDISDPKLLAVKSKILDTEVDHLTPMQALTLIAEMKSALESMD